MRRWVVVAVVAVLAFAGVVVLVRHRAEKRLESGNIALSPHGRPPTRTAHGVPIPSWLGQMGAPARKIAGRVTYQGQGAEGATVRLTSVASEAGAMPVLTISTSKAGDFDFGELPAAEYTVTAIAAGRAPAGERVDLRVGVPNAPGELSPFHL